MPRSWTSGRVARVSVLVLVAALAAPFFVADGAATPMRVGAATPRGMAAPTLPMGSALPSEAEPLVGGLSSTSVGVLVVDAGRHQCTASVIASRSRRLLATAAHCVWLEGRWQLEGAYFIPGFAAGEEPLGRWPVDRAWVSQAWKDAESPIEDVAAQVDVAFVSLQRLDGRLPEQVLGAQGAAWSLDDGARVAVLGYPVLPPYDGSSLRECSGQAQVEPFRTAAAPRKVVGHVLVLPCDMTEGASGGPWLVGPDAGRGRGRIVGVVSGGDDTDLVSPLFGPEARQIYNTADAAALDSDEPGAQRGPDDSAGTGGGTGDGGGRS